MYQQFFNLSTPAEETSLPVTHIADHEIAHVDADITSDLSDIGSEISQFNEAHNRFNNMNETFNYLEKTNHQGGDAVRNARALLTLALQGVQAEEDQPAIEADEAGSIAVEVFKSARENIKKFLAWIVSKYETIKKRVSDFFKKYLGSIERLERSVQKYGEKLSEMSDWVLKEKADKVDFLGYATSLSRLGKPVKDLAEVKSGVEEMTAVTNGYAKHVIGRDAAKEVDQFAKDVKAMKSEDFDGSVLPSAAAMMHATHQRFDKLSSELKAVAVTGDSRFGRSKVRGLKSGLLANANIFISTPVAQAEEANAINLGSIRVMSFSDSTKKDQPKKAEMKIASISELEQLNNSIVAGLASLKDLVRGQQREVFNDNVGKIYTAVKGMEKAIGDENYTAEVRSSISKVDSAANRLNELGQSSILSLSSVARTSYAAADRLVRSHAANYEKPKAA